MELFRQCGIFVFHFSIRFWNCSDSVVFFVFHFSIRIWNCSDSVVSVFHFSIRFWNCSNSVVSLFFIFLLDFRTVPTVWLLCFSFFYWILELFIQCGIFVFHFSVRIWNCSDSVVFFVFHYIISHIFRMHQMIDTLNTDNSLGSFNGILNKGCGIFFLK